MGSKKKYVSKCLKLPNSSRKVAISILKIFTQNEKYLEIFSKKSQCSVKKSQIKIEKKKKNSFSWTGIWTPVSQVKVRYPNHYTKRTCYKNKWFYKDINYIIWSRDGSEHFFAPPGTPISRYGAFLLHQKLSFAPIMNLRSSCFTKSYVEKKFLFMYVFCTKSAVMDTFCKRFSKSRLFLKSASLSDSGKVIGFFQ